MLFNSIEFGVFFVVVATIYFTLPFGWRPWLLLVASYFFYACWRWQYSFLIGGITLVNYLAARAISAALDRRRRQRAILAVVLATSLGCLFYFKYYGFARGAVDILCGRIGRVNPLPALEIVLPVGISFYTFQALSYTIDVYRSAVRAEPRLSRVALYVAFFPQLVAGPIERASHLLGQFRRENRFDLERLFSGAPLIVWGLFKKVVIADRLAEYVNLVYGHPDRYSGSTLALATYFFAFQIYCDFSGYSDIAIGTARILGYDVMQNFRLPYLSTSIRDFWRRWHVSLSSWFADYLYIPLGGSRVSVGRWVFNVLVVFLLSGLWHGANWTFLAWGGLFGVYYVTERAAASAWDRWGRGWRGSGWIWRTLKRLWVFHVVLLAWVFFRAQTLGEAVLIVRRILTDVGGRLYLGPSQLATGVGVGLIGLLMSVQVLQHLGWVSLYDTRSRMPRPVRWAGYMAMIFGIAILGKSNNEFIYFQF